MKLKSIDNFFIPVNNLEQAQQFYQSVLNMNIKFNFLDKGIIGFRVGDDETAIVLKDKTKFVDSKPTIWFEVDNVKDTYNYLLLKGLRFLSEPFELNMGFAVEFEDPFGNRLGITDYSKL